MRYNGSAIGMGDGMDSEYATSDGARLSVTDRVVAEILRLIAAGDIVPGDNLPAERKLAEMLGVSRVSVRAALQTLKAQGFLTAVQGGGTRVVSSAAEPDPALAELVKLDRSNMRDLMDLRCEIEVWAARRAARHASEASLSELRAAFGNCEAGGGRQGGGGCRVSHGRRQGLGQSGLSACPRCDTRHARGNADLSPNGTLRGAGRRRHGRRAPSRDCRGHRVSRRGSRRRGHATTLGLGERTLHRQERALDGVARAFGTFHPTL
jgi:DNA-binding transcriptional regulator YhcF (GntR family)